MSECIKINPKMFVIKSGSQIECEHDGEIFSFETCTDISVSNLEELEFLIVKKIKKLPTQE